MKTMVLTRGLSCLVDDDTFEWAAQVKWAALSGRGGKWYAGRTVRLSTGQKTTVYLHRIIAGAIAGQEVDHRDGDTLNNRRGNLRLVTHQQNQQNVRAGYGACRVRGVTPTRSGRYRAQVKVAGRTLTFGTFDTIAEAASAALTGRLRALSHSDGR